MPVTAAGRLRLLLCGALTLICFSHPAHAQSSDQTPAPIIRIETGMHSAQIPSIATDAANHYLVTGSNDKTVRVWDAQTGRLLETLRPPLGVGDEGKIYAVAVSPDGSTIACGGYTNAVGQGICLYIFDRATGQIQRRITGLANVVLSLAFSPNGRYLAATLGKQGLAVFSASDGSPVAQDTQYVDSCYGADFASDGRLVTACLDGYIRLYDTDFKRLARVPAPEGRFPWSAAFSPDGKHIAIGYFDSTKVSVVSAQDLSLQYSPDTTSAANGNLKSVEWSHDGQYLFAGGKYQKGGKFLIRRWADGGHGSPTDLEPGSADTIAALCPLKNGDLAWSGTDPAWGVLADDKARLNLAASIIDYRNEGDAFQLSSDGRVVQFQDASRLAPPVSPSIRFSFDKRGFLTGTSENLTLTPPITTMNGLNVTDWQDSTAPKLDGQPLTLTVKQHDKSHCLAIAPDGSRFVIGTELEVQCYDKTGHELWHAAAPDVTWAVNVAANGLVCAAAFGDGTIHWYQMSDGKGLLALSPSADLKRWIAWTPKGYYDCSVGGEDLIGWQLNRGEAKASDFFPCGQFRADYYRPNVVAQTIKATATAPQTSTIKTAEAAPIAKLLPPVISILSPRDGASVSTAQVTLHYTVRTPSGEPASRVRAYIDGRPIATQRDLRLVSRNDSPGDPSQITVTIPQRNCELSLVAENQFASSVPAVIQLSWEGKRGLDPSAVKPKLYVLAVGISRYQDPSIALRYGASDAQGFAQAVQSQKGLLYSDVEEKVLTDGAATKAGILNGLKWIQEQTTAQDVAMVFFAGHGANDPDTGAYLFIPSDFDRQHFLNTSVLNSDIKNTVQSIPGKAVFFIDTCHAGNVMGGGNAQGTPDTTGTVNELASPENGVVVFCASTGDQVSFEDQAWGHGAFTKALVEGLGGDADYTHTGRITINTLDLYLSERVKALTNGEQTPATTKPNSVPDFSVAVLKSH